MIYLLDTNAWASYLNHSDSVVARKIAAMDVSDIRLCTVVQAELYFGAYKSLRRDANLKLLELLFSTFQSFPLDNAAAHEYGRIRATLSRLGTPIGPNDLLIAGIAIANDVTLVTHNVREFSRVPSLRIEDWEASP